MLDPSSLAQMTATGFAEYGLGTSRYLFGDTIGFGHDGRTSGYASLLVVLPRDPVAVAVLVNADEGDILRRIGERLFRTVTP